MSEIQRLPFPPPGPTPAASQAPSVSASANGSANVSPNPIKREPVPTTPAHDKNISTGATPTSENLSTTPPAQAPSAPPAQDTRQFNFPINSNSVHLNAKTTTHVNNGTTTTKTNILSPVCRNCKTQTTPLWRRDETGQVLCNACGLFLKLHGRPRPISLKTDTIKSRNRIKQSSGKGSGPNTPELKSKDLRPPPGKKSPKVKKKSQLLTPNTSVLDSNASLTPLLPAAGAKALLSNHLGPHGHHLPNHLNHQVQPLHYPSSTPTQFAPGLQRITSPLLLSTTLSLSNARSSSNNMSAVQAAGALETMSNELGPSATFKPASASSKNGVSLINPTLAPAVKKESLSVFSTPSSALNAPPPKLPALGKTVSLPLFGPQFHLSSNPESARESGSATPLLLPNASKTSLPPLHQVASQAGSSSSLPHFQNSFSNLGEKGSTTPNESNNEAPSQPPSSSNNSNNNKNNDNHEITLLKTRISELELVNDLYRTRIMELEAMEQAARLRENSMRKRLDEVLRLQEELKNQDDGKRPGDFPESRPKRTRT